jgi:hypothetical protein
MKRNKTAALIYENDNGHLDHLAPYCSLHNIPLFLTSSILYKAAVKQYTELTVYLSEPNTVCKAILEDYDILISTLPKQILDPLFLLDEMLLQKKLKTYWLPHGSSDKENMDALIKEDNLLIYGEKMKSMLPLKVRDICSFIGNFRYTYFLKHRPFYDILIINHYPEIFKKENILYAPSWESSDITEWVYALTAKKNAGVNLYIKLHPNTHLSVIGSVIREKFDNIENVFFIEDFFPIYPILEKTSALFTDISSIGYDFLTFDRPLFFTTKNKDPLHTCGIEINKDDPYKYIETDNHSNKRKTLYKKTY